MTTETREKPDYLGLLNAISVAESRAGVYLKRWGEVTPNPELKKVLSLVAARETAHGEVFRQRIARLGFSLRVRDDPAFTEQLRVYGDPDRSDIEKIRYSRARDEEPADEPEKDRADPLDGIAARASDESVDELTRDTLRWYVHEERDSAALLREIYAYVESSATGEGTAATLAGLADPALIAGSRAVTPIADLSNGDASLSGDTRALIECMSAGFAGMQQSIAALSGSMARKKKHKDKHKDEVRA